MEKETENMLYLPFSTFIYICNCMYVQYSSHIYTIAFIEPHDIEYANCCEWQQNIFFSFCQCIITPITKWTYTCIHSHTLTLEKKKSICKTCYINSKPPFFFKKKNQICFCENVIKFKRHRCMDKRKVYSCYSERKNQKYI